MKRLPIVIMIVVAGIFLAFQSLGSGTGNPPDKYEKILKLVGEMLTQAHFSPQEVNDDFSKKIFKKYLESLDPEKNIFINRDIVSLKKKYETSIDDEIKGAPVEFFLSAGKIFNTRMEEVSAMCNELLSKSFDFTTDEEVILDKEIIEYIIANLILFVK